MLGGDAVIPTDTDNNSKNKFVSGVFVLLVANIFVKIIGLIFKIPIQRLIGDSGMGYFNIAYNVYAWFYIVSTAGLPVAVSVMTAQAEARGRGGEARCIFRCAVILFSVIGVICTAVMMLFAGKLADASSVGGAYACIISVAPTVFFVCISSAVRGHYQGYGIMWPTGLSQIIEAAGKMVLGLLFANYSVSKGDPLYITSAYAISGITLGSALSALFCIIVKAFYRIKRRLPSAAVGKSAVMKQMLSIAFPITISASVMNLTGLIDVFTASGRLQSIGYTELQATEIFGNYTTLAVSMFNMPMVFVYPFAYAIVPALTASVTSKNSAKTARIVNSAFKIAAVISLPCAVGLGVLSEPILALIFPAASAYLAAPMLSVLSVSVFFCAMLAMSNSVLQASGNEKLPVISMLCGACVKLVCSYLLTGYPPVGRFGIPVGTGLCYLIIIIINVTFAIKRTGAKLSLFSVIGKPIIASAVCGISAYRVNLFFASVLPSKAAVLLAIAISAVLYILTLLLIRGFDAEDIAVMPKAHRIYPVMKKLKLIK